MASLLIDDDGLVATGAVGKVVSRCRLFVHDGMRCRLLLTMDAVDETMDDGTVCCTGRGKRYVLKMTRINAAMQRRQRNVQRVKGDNKNSSTM